MNPFAIVPLVEDLVGSAAGHLAEAFFDDPLEAHALADPGSRLQRARGQFEWILRYGVRFGSALTTAGNPVGAAVALYPPEPAIVAEKATTLGFATLRTLLGDEAMLRFAQVAEYLEHLRLRHVEPDHCYLLTLGVAPAHQRRGVGSALVSAVLKRAGDLGLSTFVETAQRIDVPFYERHGFRRVHEGVEPHSGLRLWALVRPPSIAA
jgi:ribosomal protein S18 acetylase RimI-like enzyme